MNARINSSAAHEIVRQAIGMRRQYNAEGALELLLQNEDQFSSAPDRVSLLIAKGDCYKQLKRNADAMRSFESALELEPANNFARTSLASVHIHRQDYGAAEAQFKLILDREPANPYALTGLARVTKMTGRSQEARDYYSHLLEVPGLPDGIRTEARSYLAPPVRSAFALRSPQEVVAAAETSAPAPVAAKTAPPAPLTSEERLREQEQKVAADPRNVGARHVLATLLMKAGRQDDAAGQWQQILTIDTHNAQARQSLQKLGASPARGTAPAAALPAAAEPQSPRVFRIAAPPKEELVAVDDYEVIVSVDGKQVGRMEFRLPADADDQADQTITGMVNLIFSTNLSATLSNPERNVSRRVVASDEVAGAQRRDLKAV